MNAAPLSTDLHSSVKHGDCCGRPHQRVRVGISFKDPATLKTAQFTAKLYQKKVLDGAHFHIKLPAKQRRKQPQIGHYELFWEAELNSNEQESGTLRNVLWKTTGKVHLPCGPDAQMFHLQGPDQIASALGFPQVWIIIS